MKTYRQGATGALTDEYEKAIIELQTLLSGVSLSEFNEIKNPSLNENSKSIRNVITHVVRSGYSYANYIRNRFGEEVFANEFKIETIEDAKNNLEYMFLYTQVTLKDKGYLSHNDMMHLLIKTAWTTYDLEAMIEHAIVHILRHRLQIQKMLR
ncbi:hypothetical protein [Flavobacterium sp.]|uniref:hypothetical protein n=1 Tax=Flavobacterium sp. TaxID=239 RepID=UPI0037A729D9